VTGLPTCGNELSRIPDGRQRVHQQKMTRPVPQTFFLNGPRDVLQQLVRERARYSY
jgi:hypothetical protein